MVQIYTPRLFSPDSNCRPNLLDRVICQSIFGRDEGTVSIITLELFAFVCFLCCMDYVSGIATVVDLFFRLNIKSTFCADPRIKRLMSKSGRI